jgi:preprotein translocase SecE subunit
MAKPSRQQRRERRAQQPALAGAGAPPTAPTPRTARGGDEPERRRPEQRAETQGGGGPIGFVRESYAELKKVEWPDQKAVISGTVVVIVACAIVGAYLYLNDQVWSYVIKHVLLR